jgi:two-component system response regulator
MATSGVEILLVEDNKDDEDLTLHALKKYNVTNRIQVVRDGVEALEFIFCTDRYAHRRISDRPKVILLDIKLPLVDGLEVLKKVKQDERTKTIPVVMLTSSREERDLLESYRLGVNSYITKPVDFDQFTEAARTLGMYWLLLNRPPAEAA